MRHITTAFILLLACAAVASAQRYTISTVAGAVMPPQTPAFATSRSFGFTYGVTVDRSGNFYFSSSAGCVYKVDQNGILNRVAGVCRNGYSGDNGLAVNAQLNEPWGLALSAAGDLYIADRGNNRVRKVTAGGVITTVAGTGTPGVHSGGDDGPAILAQLEEPAGVALDSAGNLYIGETSGVRMVSTAGIITRFAGNPHDTTCSGEGGLAKNASMSAFGLAFDRDENLLAADAYCRKVWKIWKNGSITALMYDPTTILTGVAVDGQNNAYVASFDRLLKLSPSGTISTIAVGGPLTGPDDTHLGWIHDLALDLAGNLLITGSERVHRMTPAGVVSTAAGGTLSGIPASTTQLMPYFFLATDQSGALYISEQGGHRISKVENGLLSQIAGNGMWQNSGDGGPAVQAGIGSPEDLALDPAGNLFFSSTAVEIHCAIRKVAPSGLISTIAGGGQCGTSGDGGPATSAQISPSAIATDGDGNIYVLDYTHLRKITAGGQINNIAGVDNWSGAFSGDGGPATSAQLAGIWPGGIALDSAKNIYLADSAPLHAPLDGPQSVARIRKIRSNGIINTIAGNGEYGYSGDDGPATSAKLTITGGIASDAAGNLYLSSYDRIRKVSANGIITTIAGSGGLGYTGDGGLATDAQIGFVNDTTLGPGGVIYFSDLANSVVRKLTPISSPAQLSITMTHSGTFVQGQHNTAYSITIKNSAHAGGTIGTVTVTEILPAALTLVSMSGSGWECSGTTCSRTDSLAPGSSYSPITVTVNVSSTAPAQIVNQASVAGGGSDPATISDATTIQTSPLGFIPLTPCRIADTRTYGGKSGAFGPPFMPGNSTRDFAIPLSGCGIPATAQAYSLNITVVPRGYLGYLAVWPTGAPQPNVSTLNSFSGSIVANAAVVPAGANGAISVYSHDDTDVIIDINGYFNTPTAQTLVFYPVAPCRLADTRPFGGKTGAFGAPTIAGGAIRSFPVPSSSCGIPATAQAYSLNMTAIPTSTLGYLTTWPAGQPQPLVSTLNAPLGGVIANAAIVPAGAGGAINVYASATTDLIVDINGYFAPPGAPGGLSLYPLTPCRIADTRSYGGKSGAFGPPAMAAGETRTYNLPSSACGVPATAKAYSLNLSVWPAARLQWLTTWPTGQAQPLVSTLNAYQGGVIANAAMVPAGASGAINVFATDITDLFFDINGYFAP